MSGGMPIRRPRPAASTRWRAIPFFAAQSSEVATPFLSRAGGFPSSKSPARERPNPARGDGPAAGLTTPHEARRQISQALPRLVIVRRRSCPFLHLVSAHFRNSRV